MATVFPGSVHIRYLDMGIEQETLAYPGGIQYPVDMAELDGASAAFDINTRMTQQYLLPMARNLNTGQTVKTQDLTGTRLLPQQRKIAEALSTQLADKMTARTGDTWVGFTQLYTPSTRR
jgi:hypothetical protein